MDQSMQQSFEQFLRSDEAQKAMMEDQVEEVKEFRLKKLELIKEELAKCDEEAQRLVYPFLTNPDRVPFAIDMLFSFARNDEVNGPSFQERCNSDNVKRIFKKLWEEAKEKKIEGIEDLQDRWYHSVSGIAEKDAQEKGEEKAMILTTDMLVPVLNNVQTCKYEGNQLFARKKYEEALEKYTKAVMAAPPAMKAAAPHDQVELDKVTTAALKNQAQAAIFCDQPMIAIEATTRVLKLHPEDSKSLYRRGVAYGMLGDADGEVRSFITTSIPKHSFIAQGEKNLRKLIHQEPHNMEARSALKKLLQSRANMRKREKRIAQRMMDPNAKA